MKKRLWIASVVVMGWMASFASANGPAESVLESEQVLSELMAIPAKQIPRQLMSEAQGIAIIPNVIKIGFVGGARRGHGVVVVRDADGEWSLPQFVTLTGGSVGFQAGIQGSDVVLVFTTKKGVEGLMRGKFTVGVDASASAGPVGRDAEIGTDATLRSEIYSYSRSRGLFLGVAVDGSMLEIDHASHAFYYGTPTGQLPARIPRPADDLRRLLTDLTPHANAGPTTTPRQIEALRRALFQQAGQLHATLTPEWRQFLAVPKELQEAGHIPSAESMALVLKRYSQVNGSPEYRKLHDQPEFKRTYELLIEYEKAIAVTHPPLVLPPPPKQ